MTLAATTDQPDSIASLRATEYAAIRSQARQLAGLAGFRWNETRVVAGELGAERVSVAPVSTSLFDVLRVTPALGRGFRPDEERPGAGDVAVVSYEFWQRYFQGRSDVLERSVAIDNRPFAIVGVAPAGLRLEFTSDPHLRAGHRLLRGRRGDQRDRAARSGRRRSGSRPSSSPIFDATLDQAARARGRHVRVRDLDESTRAATWRTYVVFMVAAAVLLFAACANVANLLLGRGVARRPEFVLRAALGSSRSRLLRQLLVESLIVAGAAAAAGLALGAFIRAFVARACLMRHGRADRSRSTSSRVLRHRACSAHGRRLRRAPGAPGAAPRLAGRARERGTASRQRAGQRRLRSGLLAIQVTLAFLLLERRHSHEQLLPAESGAARVHAGQRPGRSARSSRAIATAAARNCSTCTASWRAVSRPSPA